MPKPIYQEQVQMRLQSGTDNFPTKDGFEWW